MLVYKITNKSNQKVYIGKTAGSLRLRWKQHLASAKKGQSQSLYRAIRKYGVDGFLIEEIGHHKTSEEMDFVEIAMIHIYHSNDGSGYNMTDGGEGVLGHRHSFETRKRLGDMRRGQKRPLSESHKEAVRQAILRWYAKPSVRDRQVQNLRKRNQDPAIAAKMREARSRPEVEEKRRRSITEAHAKPEVKARFCLAQKLRRQREKESRESSLFL